MQIFEFGDEYGLKQLVPDHMKDTLVNYFTRGWSPGGYTTSLLAGDLYGAVMRADAVNKEFMYLTAQWIMHNAPEGSWGSIENVDNWINDVGGRRSRWVTNKEKAMAWNILNAQS